MTQMSVGERDADRVGEHHEADADVDMEVVVSGGCSPQQVEEENDDDVGEMTSAVLESLLREAAEARQEAESARRQAAEAGVELPPLPPARTRTQWRSRMGQSPRKQSWDEYDGKEVDEVAADGQGAEADAADIGPSGLEVVHVPQDPDAAAEAPLAQDQERPVSEEKSGAEAVAEEAEATWRMALEVAAADALTWQVESAVQQVMTEKIEAIVEANKVLEECLAPVLSQEAKDLDAAELRLEALSLARMLLEELMQPALWLEAASDITDQATARAEATAAHANKRLHAYMADISACLGDRTQLLLFIRREKFADSDPGAFDTVEGDSSRKLKSEPRLADTAQQLHVNLPEIEEFCNRHRAVLSDIGSCLQEYATCIRSAFSTRMLLGKPAEQNGGDGARGIEGWQSRDLVALTSPEELKVNVSAVTTAFEKECKRLVRLAAAEAARQRRLNPPPADYACAARPPDSIPTVHLATLASPAREVAATKERMEKMVIQRSSRSLSWGAPRHGTCNEATYGSSTTIPIDELVAQEQAWMRECSRQIAAGVSDRLPSNLPAFATRLPEPARLPGALPAGCRVGGLSRPFVAPVHKAHVVSEQERAIKQKEAEICAMQQKLQTLSSGMRFLEMQIHASARSMGRYDETAREMKILASLIKVRSQELDRLRDGNFVVAPPAVTAWGRDHAQRMAGPFSLPKQMERAGQSLARVRQEVSCLVGSLKHKDVLVYSDSHSDAFSMQTERDPFASKSCMLLHRPHSAMREMATLEQSLDEARNIQSRLHSLHSRQRVGLLADND